MNPFKNSEDDHKLIAKGCYTYTLLYVETPGNEIVPPFDYLITPLEDNGDGFDQKLELTLPLNADNRPKLLDMVASGSKKFKIVATSTEPAAPV